MRVVDVSPAGRGDVYDLAVTDPVHAFAVNGGILVSNCYDALRYLVVELERRTPGPGGPMEPLAGSKTTRYAPGAQRATSPPLTGDAASRQF